MLVVSFATILNTPYDLVKFAIIILGILYTFGWLYVNVRIRKRMDFLKNNYLIKHDQLYRKYIISVKDFFEKHIHISSEILPKATFLFWIFLLLHMMKLRS